MEDTLINFETAKLAKEKKFNTIINYYYDSFGDICSSNIKVNWNDSKELLTSAPTQSLLQKWLREVHNIIIDVKLDFFNSYNKESIKYYPIFYTYSDSKNRFWLYTDYINSDECTEEIQDKMPIFQKYSTYEEALEIGLQEALKLI